MAFIEIVTPKDAESAPPNVERLDVIVWSRCGREGQPFGIGSGVNFNASYNYWVEIRHSVQGIPVFHTRSLFQDLRAAAGRSKDIVERFRRGELDVIGVGGEIMPETAIVLKRIRFPSHDQNGVERESEYYRLTISVDMGVVYRSSAPGEWMNEIHLDVRDPEDHLRFMGELLDEMERAHRGLHPDPASLPPEFSEWSFARELNRRSYDAVAQAFRADYFADAQLDDTFNAWMDELPQGGRVLDAGCGHGDPVIGRLLEKGFRVTGSDHSPAMLARARRTYPQAEFVEVATGDLEMEAVFDGACSFSSLVYQDPIDLLHGIYRLHRALKPGGLLFLYGSDLDPAWRSNPYRIDLKQWMWGSFYSSAEIAHVLEEHGYFEVLQTINFSHEEESQEKDKETQPEAQAPPQAQEPSFDGKVIKLPPFPSLESAPPQDYVVIARKPAVA